MSSAVSSSTPALVAALVLPAVSGCLAATSVPLEAPTDAPLRTFTGTVPDAGWFALAIEVDDHVNVSDVDATVTLHHEERTPQDNGIRWGCAWWGARPIPEEGLGAGHMNCIAYTPDGRLEAGVQAMGNGHRVSTNDPLCCLGISTSDTFRLSDYSDGMPFDYYRQVNRSVVHFVVFGGGPLYGGLTYNISVSPDVTVDWMAGRGDEAYAYERGDFTSDLWARADTPGNQYYVQQEAHLEIDPHPTRSEIFAMWVSDYYDVEDNAREGRVRFPGGHVAHVPTSWYGTSWEQGPWEFHLYGSEGEWADTPVLYISPVVWLSPGGEAG